MHLQAKSCRFRCWNPSIGTLGLHLLLRHRRHYFLYHHLHSLTVLSSELLESAPPGICEEFCEVLVHGAVRVIRRSFVRFLRFLSQSGLLGLELLQHQQTITSLFSVYFCSPLFGRLCCFCHSLAEPLRPVFQASLAFCCRLRQRQQARLPLLFSPNLFFGLFKPLACFFVRHPI